MHVYGQDAPEQLMKRIASLEGEHERLLEALLPHQRSHFRHRHASASSVPGVPLFPKTSPSCCICTGAELRHLRDAHIYSRPDLAWHITYSSDVYHNSNKCQEVNSYLRTCPGLSCTYVSTGNTVACRLLLLLVSAHVTIVRMRHRS